MSDRCANSSVSMTDVANRAGVSQSTVSRVINRRSGIKPETRDSVLEALRELGYKSDIMSLMNPEPEARVFHIAIAICPLPEQDDPFAMEYFSLLTQGIQAVLAGRNAVWRQETLRTGALEAPELEECDGCILMGVPTPELRASLRRNGVPYVIAGELTGNGEDVVIGNKFEGSVEGCAHLLKLGVRRFGFLITLHDLPVFAGFQTELLRNGIYIQPGDLRITEDSRASTFIREIHRWIAEKTLPEALFVSYLEAAVAVKTMLELNHLRVPEDIRIMTLGHYDSREPIDTLDVDVKGIGRLAGKRLLEKILEPDDPPVQISVPMMLNRKP